MNKITEMDGKEGYIFNRHDDHIVLHREITNKLHMSEDWEWIRADHGPHVKHEGIL